MLKCRISRASTAPRPAYDAWTPRHLASCGCIYEHNRTSHNKRSMLTSIATGSTSTRRITPAAPTSHPTGSFSGEHTHCTNRLLGRLGLHSTAIFFRTLLLTASTFPKDGYLLVAANPSRHLDPSYRASYPGTWYCAWQQFLVGSQTATSSTSE